MKVIEDQSVVKWRQELLATFEDKLDTIQERTRVSEGEWMLEAGIAVLQAALHDYMCEGQLSTTIWAKTKSSVSLPQAS
jgi:hypothetical protein